MRKRFMLSAVAAFAPLAVAGLVPAHAASASAPLHVSKAITATHGVNKLLKKTFAGKNEVDQSGNWSGYDVNGTGITGVTSSFTVPTAGIVPPGFSASWVGIGGYTTTDLIQAGTTSDTLPVGGGQYYAWYEILPASETQLTNCVGDSSCTVNPGDKISVDIHNVGTNLWSISEVDAGHWTWQQNIAYTSSESSAEWILEAPTFVTQTVLGGVGNAYFGNGTATGNTYTDGTGTHAIGDAPNPIQVDLSDPTGLFDEAIPSALAANKSSFDSCAYATSCAAPSS